MESLIPQLEAQRTLSIGRTLLYQLMDAGELETVKIGRRRLVVASSIDAYIEKLRSMRRLSVPEGDGVATSGDLEHGRAEIPSAIRSTSVRRVEDGRRTPREVLA